MKNLKRRVLSAVLCLVMGLTLLPTAAMAAGRFTDVAETDWFYADVEYAVELGLVNGTSPTTYAPNDNLTYSAAIKLAACMHKKVTQGNTDFTVGTPWYQVYVDYALANGIISADKTYDWTAYATRAGYMEIFAKAIPDTGLKRGYKALTAINRVDDNTIPDVSISHPQAEAIYKLYRAGILQGSSAVTHQCNPNNFIQRSEVATILTRMMNADARVKFEMIGDGGMTVTQQPEDVASLSSDGRASFSTAVTGGKGPYTYKWFLSEDNGSTWSAIVNNTQYSGVSTKKLTVKLSSLSAYTGTLYRCQISDAAGHQIVTRSACITVTGSGSTSPLTITRQPEDETCKAGNQAAFTVAVSGGKAPYTYQWQTKAKDSTIWSNLSNNAVIDGAKTAELLVIVTQNDFTEGFQYRCVITDANGNSVTSDAAAAIEPASTLTITQQPKNETCKAGNQAVFTVAVSGGKAPYTYQWQIINERSVRWVDLSNNDIIDGAKTAELLVIVTQNDFTEGFQYRCVITDANGNSVTSDAAAAIEPVSALTITYQPKDMTCSAGGLTAFNVVVSGGKAPYTYQWQLSSEGSSRWSNLSDNSVIEGAKTDVLMIIVNEQDFEFGYRYRCVITDANGNSVTSDAATVIEPASALVITRQPKDATCSVGEQAVFTVVAAGGKTPYTYQWQWQTRNDDDSKWADLTSGSMSGAKTNELKVDVMQVDFTFGYRYRCVITDANGNSVISDTVTVVAP